ncbi:hypothetical protein JOB18_040672 [Solea senegalensis]|uniref:Uncharacterized protein n=1 Tax=Solea senegalensis TaxID=28829 RepID=A0AAV6REE3_SOLSE|nr:hypothetical protein JOB18_040672 [Solea senegalensis]
MTDPWECSTRCKPQINPHNSLNHTQETDEMRVHVGQCGDNCKRGTSDQIRQSEEVECPRMDKSSDLHLTELQTPGKMQSDC